MIKLLNQNAWAIRRTMGTTSLVVLAAVIVGCGESSTFSEPNKKGARVPSSSSTSIAQGELSEWLRTEPMADLQGRIQPWFPEKARALLLIFIRQDCPIANQYVPRILRLHEAYEPRGIHCVLVHVDRRASREELLRHANDYGLSFSVVHDSKHELVARVGASVTPEAALVDRQGHVLYLGRMDDQYADLGKKRPQPERHDLIEALDAFLAGAVIPASRVPAVGCWIERP